MFDVIITYFIIGFSLVVGGLCGFAFMSMVYMSIDSFGIVSKKDK